jgi:hypothetical protein
MKKMSAYSRVRRNVRVVPIPIRRPAPPRYEADVYVSKLEAREFLRDLAWFLEILARLFARSGFLGAGRRGGLAISEIEARPRVYKGDTEAVYVRVSNTGTNEETGDVILTDATENVLIGRQTVTLPPGDSQMVKFNWETKGFRLGDHDLDAEVELLGGRRPTAPTGK